MLDDLRSRRLSAKSAEGKDIRSLMHACERLENNAAAASLLIYKPGPLQDVINDVPKYAAVYLRGMREVGTFLQGIETF